MWRGPQIRLQVRIVAGTSTSRFDALRWVVIGALEEPFVGMFCVVQVEVFMFGRRTSCRIGYLEAVH